MDYTAWAEEYFSSSRKLNDLIHRLKTQRKSCCPSSKQELDQKITHYRSCYYECMRIGNILAQRARDVKL